ncbi:hypothetical protein Pan216_15790 [Planctomycetes bacterium Pan216]|uniref:Uncharacterized protein n=1 Tax=Kolteria novifilia TaxID=2527975 RepID=A0A518B178_9BACT|nr:hypothetical protein Pan216_15790 [Planctomycetes bacterium Pan216]
MAVKCPKCEHPLQRDAEGNLPSRCPACGVAFKKKRRTSSGASAEAAKPSSTPTGDKAAKAAAPSKRRSAEERTAKPKRPAKARPSKKSPASSSDDPFGTNESSSSSPFGGDSDNPFGDSGSAAPPAASDPFGGDDGGFAGGGDDGAGDALFGDSPGGATSHEIRRPKKSGDGMLYTIAGIVALLAVGGGAFFFRDQILSSTGWGGDNRIINQFGNYAYVPLEEPWDLQSLQQLKSRPEVANRDEIAKSDIAYHHPEQDAWFVIQSTELRGSTPSAVEVADRTLDEWRKQLSDFELLGSTKTSFKGKPAFRIEAQGAVAGNPERRQAIVFYHQGIRYRLALFAPTEKFPSIESEMDGLLDQFALLGDRKGWENSVVADNKVEIFHGHEYPYELTARGGWEENPEIPVGSKISDLKLISSDREGYFVVTTRKARPVEELKQRYLRRLERIYGKAEPQEPVEGEEVEINGLKAHRFKIATRSDAGGDQFFLVNFITGGEFDGKELIYLVEGMCSADQAGDYEHIFAEIADSFKLLDEVRGEKSEATIAAEAAMKGKEVAAADPATSAGGNQPAMAPVNRSPIATGPPPANVPLPSKDLPSLDDLE